MAKGKKSKGTHYVSKGERVSVNKKIRNAIRKERTQLQRARNQTDAWLKGKNVVLTIENPNKKETNKRFIRVNANDFWGSHRKYLMKQTASE